MSSSHTNRRLSGLFPNDSARIKQYRHYVNELGQLGHHREDPLSHFTSLVHEASKTGTPLEFYLALHSQTISDIPNEEEVRKKIGEAAEWLAEIDGSFIYKLQSPSMLGEKDAARLKAFREKIIYEQQFGWRAHPTTDQVLRLIQQFFLENIANPNYNHYLADAPAWSAIAYGFGDCDTLSVVFSHFLTIAGARHTPTTIDLKESAPGFCGHTFLTVRDHRIVAPYLILESTVPEAFDVRNLVTDDVLLNKTTPERFWLETFLADTASGEIYPCVEGGAAYCLQQEWYFENPIDDFEKDGNLDQNKTKWITSNHVAIGVHYAIKRFLGEVPVDASIERYLGWKK